MKYANRLPALFLLLALVFPTLPAAKSGPAPVTVGQIAPDYTLPSQDGQAVGPKDFAGQWVVLYFYPKDFTGGCTLEARNFQRDSVAYAKANAAVVGVSVDSPDSHKRFCTQEGLRFKLLSDTAGTVSARYGSLKSILGKKLSSRHTFILDPEGKVARIFREVQPSGHSAEVLAALGELQKK
jgi:peroxiredoxin Q/BCP